METIIRFNKHEIIEILSKNTGYNEAEFEKIEFDSLEEVLINGINEAFYINLKIVFSEDGDGLTGTDKDFK